MMPTERAGAGESSSSRRVGSALVSLAAFVILLAALLVLILLGDGSSAEDVARPDVSAEIQYDTPRQLAILANEQINESSGLAVSRLEPGLFWTHNDSGDKSRIFAFDLAGNDRGEFDLPKTKANDWEDMASVTLNGKSFLVVGDVGDNARRRKFCSLFVVDEPTRPAKSYQKTGKVQEIRFRYEDGPRDCEAIAVDGASKQVFLMTKAFAILCPIYQIAWPAEFSDEILVARRIGSVQLPMVTAMDISADGRRAIMLTYGDAYEFRRAEKETWRTAFARPPRLITMPERRQGEAITYGQDNQTLYLTSERTPTPLWQVSPQSAN